MDTNSDSVLTKDEYAEEHKEHFDGTDTNSDGVLTKDEYAEEQRRKLFLASGITPDVRGMAMGEFAALWQSYYADLEAEMNVVWNN